MLFNHISVHLLYHLTNFHEPHRCFFCAPRPRGPELRWAMMGDSWKWMTPSWGVSWIFMDFHGFFWFSWILIHSTWKLMDLDQLWDIDILQIFIHFGWFFFGSFCNILQCNLRNMVCGKFCRHVAGPGSFQLCSTLGRLFWGWDTA